MTCNEIENRLPAYLEDLLSPEEIEGIAGHLASCPRCSRALEDLKKAEQLVRDLGEVEPPPFFEQRIMSRVREEAGRKQGILRRLFYPLHIKVPIQALATILVAVLAFYVYQTGDPEMKRMAPFPIPVAEPEKDQLKAESPKVVVSPSAVTSVKQEAAGDLQEKDRQGFAAPPFEKGGRESATTDSRAPIREERPAAVEQAAGVIAVREKEIPQAGAELSGQSREGTGKRDADKALETLPSERNRKEKMAGTAAAAGESRKTMSAPSPSRMAAGAAMKRSVMDLTIHVGDTAAAIREIEAHLGQFNARIIERGRRDGSEFLKAEMAARDARLFLKQLEAIGRVNVETETFVEPGEAVIVSFKIVGRP